MTDRALQHPNGTPRWTLSRNSYQQVAQNVRKQPSDFAFPDLYLPEINCRTHMPISVAKAEDQCEFGKWLLTQHAADIAQDPRAQAVRKLHAEFHTIAGHVAELAASGKRPEAERLMSETGEFAVASSHLSEAIIAWKNGG